jgi:hypothetical protein
MNKGQVTNAALVVPIAPPLDNLMNPFLAGIGPRLQISIRSALEPNRILTRTCYPRRCSELQTFAGPVHRREDLT